jgi:copper/silver efflux system protein
VPSRPAPISASIAETGVVMLIYLNHALQEVQARRDAEGCDLSRPDLYGAIMVGAVERVRPKMMTVVAIMAGLLPITWSTGTGSEIMQRIAVPMIGGMLSSALLTLIVIPAIYGLVRELGLKFGGTAGDVPGVIPESSAAPVSQ